MVHKKSNMKTNLVNANADDIIRDLIKIIRQKELVFFVGSAISFADPSKLPSVAQVKGNIIKALCGGDLKEYFDLMYSNASIKRKINSIRHEEFIELIYRNIGNLAIGALDCLKQGEPNQNHLFLARGLGQYFDIILTANQDLLIEKALKIDPLNITEQGDKIYKNGTLIKLHGCVEIPESVITILRRLIRGLPEERENQLREIVKEKYVLFMGYGGRDEDIFRILMGSECRGIYWNIKPGSKVDEQVERIFDKYKNKFFGFEYDLNELFERLANSLNMDISLPGAFEDISLNLERTFEDWAKRVGDDRFNIIGSILKSIGRYEEALKCFNISKKTSKDSGNKMILAKTYYKIGNSYLEYKTFPDNYEKARNSFKKAKLLFSELGDIKGEAEALGGIGETYRHNAEYKKAVNPFKEVKQKLKDFEDEDCVAARASLRLGDVYRMSDRYVDALREYESAIKVLGRYGFIEDVATCRIWSGEVHKYKGDYEKALDHNLTAYKIIKRYEFEQQLGWVKYSLADINRFKSDENDSLDKFDEADKIFEKYKNRLGRAWCNEAMAEIYRVRGDYDMAEEKNKIALENYREDYKICRAYILLNEAEVLRAHGEYSKAIEKYEEVKNIKTECIRYVAHAELGIAETERLRGSGSLDDYDKILNKYENIGMIHGVVHTLIGKALFLLSMEENPLDTINRAEKISSEMRLEKESKIISMIQNDIFNKNKRSRWLHPLEFP